MRREKKIILLALILLMVGTYFIYNAILNTKPLAYQVTQGDMDLSDWEDPSQLVELKGEWWYYDGQLLADAPLNNPQPVAVPQYKKHNDDLKDYYGYGTYEMQVRGLEPNQGVGLATKEQVSAYRLWVNGVPVLENGRVGTSQLSHTSEWQPKSTVVYADSEGRLLIQVEMSNYAYPDGPFWNTIKLGGPDRIYSYMTNQIYLDSFLALAFLLIAILFILLYLYFDIDQSLLYFAILIGTVSLRIGLTSSRPLVHFTGGIPWDLLVAAEYITGYFLMPLVTLFFLSLLHQEGHRYVRVIASLMVAIFLFVMLTPITVYSKPLMPYIYGLVVNIGLGLIALVYKYRKNSFYKWLLFIGFSNLLVGLVKEIIGNAISWSPVSLLNLIICIGFILLNEFYIYVKRNEVLAVNAYIDPLTGLYNRYYLKEFDLSHFSKMMGDYHYIMFLDIDGFKGINDDHGHETGDYILQIIGQRIRNTLRTKDLVFRYGGDEFIVFVSTKKEYEINEVSKRLVQVLSEKIVKDKKEYSVGVSIGISQCKTNHKQDLEAYIHASDLAMYKAKEKGGNGFHISEILV